MSGAKSGSVNAFASLGRARRYFLKAATLATAGMSVAAMLDGWKSAIAKTLSSDSPSDCGNMNIPMKEVEGKVAFITGGSSGIGLGIARAFSDAGMKVVIGYRTKEHLDEAMKFFVADRIHAVKLDVTVRSDMEKAASEAERVFGKVHVLVNNAGVLTAGSLSETTYDDWDWTIGVNLNGVFNGMHTFLPRIQSHNEGGQIISISSIAGLFRGGGGVYSVSKFAVVGMMEALRGDLFETNIGVSVCCPGLVSSNIMDSDRNRPTSLGNSGPQFDKRTRAEVRREMEDPKLAMDPLEAGRLVLRGMRNNDLYILTHPEWASCFRARHEALMASIPAHLHPSAERLADARSTLQQTIYVRERDRKLCERNV